MNQHIKNVTTHWPMLIGLFGVAMLAAGFFAPLSASADVLGPCCTVTSGSTVPPTTTTVTATPAPVPSCSLSASASSSVGGAVSSTLSWHTSAANAAVIDNGVGTVSVSGGTKTVTFSKTTKYTMTVSAAGGGQATCSATVTPPPPPKPSCTLSANPSSIKSGDSSKLTWTTTNGDSFTIDNGVGAQSPTSTAGVSVSPTTTTTYTGTVTGAGGTATCKTTVTVTTPPPAKPTCTLSADPSAIKSGDSSTLSWKTTGATAFSIDNSIGSVTPVSSGSTSTGALTKTTTYTGTAEGPGGTATCTTTVTVTTNPPPPAKPTCTLSANPTVVQTGDVSVLSWTTTHATSFSIDQGIGDVTPVDAGSATTSPLTKDTAFTGTVTGPGGTATCKTTVTVTTKPPKPTCTLSADPTSVGTGAASVLSWTTTNATGFSIDQGIGAVTPLASGTTTTGALTQNTTFTGTVTGEGGTATCNTSVTVTTTPPPQTPTCTLSASPSSITSGGTSKLSWTTTNATSFVIDNGIGSTTPVSAGATTTPSLTSNTTYTGTAEGPNGTVTCKTTVTVSTPPPSGGGLSCTLSASPISVSAGGTTELSWTTTDAVSFSIDHGIGTTTPTATGATTSPKIGGDTTFTGTATDGAGNTVSCTAAVSIPTGGGGGGCTGSSCGGGGGGTPPPTVTLSSLPHVGNEPLAYLYLSQIPYTGLNLGPVGTAIYWTVFGIISLILAYFVLFGLVPFANNARRDFFGRLWATVLPTPRSGRSAAEEEVVETPAPEPAPAPQSFFASAAPEAPRGYSSFDGFKSFAHGDTLSIDDIVGGLSREPATPRTAAPTSAPEPTQPAAPAMPVAEQPARPAPTPAPESVVAPADVRGIVMALLDRDRAAVFAGLRQHVRGGGSPETLISSIAFVIDDVYRARVDGTRCDAEIAAQTAPLPTVVLEKLVGSLATAIDSSYTDSVTGAKMALTRALDAIGA